jgi:hypothetical protein
MAAAPDNSHERMYGLESTRHLKYLMRDTQSRDGTMSLLCRAHSLTVFKSFGTRKAILASVREMSAVIREVLQRLAF